MGEEEEKEEGKEKKMKMEEEEMRKNSLEWEPEVWVLAPDL